MAISEMDLVKANYDHARTKAILLETQMQLIQSQYQLVRQDIQKYESELQILQEREKVPAAKE